MPNNKFRVEASEAHFARGEWSIAITQNGYQWDTVGVTVADRGKAERIAAYLLAELKPEADRIYEEQMA